MSVSVIVGGQFGGEGKGKTTSHMCYKHAYDVAVRCGGPNSGHTITFDEKQTILRQIPAGVKNPNTKLFLSAGCIIDLDVLFDEIAYFDLNPDRLKIDRNAVIISEDDVTNERKTELDNRIGSTCTGVGFAVSRRVLREEGIILAKDIPDLKKYIRNVSEETLLNHNAGKKIIIEGTQGYGLSVYHSPYYPFTTSRDTTAASFLSETGVGPLTVSEIIMVIRTFPIRVGGNSGPLFGEIDWETIQVESGCPHKLEEFTSVTNKLRRVGMFDIDLVRNASRVNGPTQIAIMGVDYIDYKNKGVKEYADLTQSAKDFVDMIRRETDVKVAYIGVGPRDQEIIDLSNTMKNISPEGRKC